MPVRFFILHQPCYQENEAADLTLFERDEELYFIMQLRLKANAKTALLSQAIKGKGDWHYK